MYEQRLRVTALALHTWATGQTGMLRALASLEEHCRECASRIPTSTGGNIQLATTMGVGIFIGSGAATFLTEQVVIALGLIALLFTLAMLQLSWQQHAVRQQREQTLPQQEVQPCDKQSRQQYSGIMVYRADEEAMTPLVEDALRHLHDRSYLGPCLTNVSPGAARLKSDLRPTLGMFVR